MTYKVLGAAVAVFYTPDLYKRGYLFHVKSKQTTEQFSLLMLGLNGNRFQGKILMSPLQLLTIPKPWPISLNYNFEKLPC